MQTNTFSFYRLGLLLRRDLISGSRVGWIVAAVVFAIFFLIVYFNVSDDAAEYRQYGHFSYELMKILLYVFTPALLISGFILSSLAFIELNRFSPKQAFLSIPATMFEKWLTKWLLTAILFPIIFVLLYQVFSQICYWAVKPMGVELVRLPLFDPLIWKLVLLYILLQSLFFLGSVGMPSYSLFKTLAVTLVLALAAFIVLNLMLRLGNPGLAETGERFGSMSFKGFRLNDNGQHFVEEIFPQLAKNVAIYVLFPIVLLISFFKFKEKEV